MGSLHPDFESMHVLRLTWARMTTMVNHGGSNMDSTQTQKTFEHERHQPRKILLDSDVYCPYSMRESDGDADCDHDFEVEPNLVQAAFAIWNCTICGRAVRFDVWN
jgi:hypothetical protein